MEAPAAQTRALQLNLGRAYPVDAVGVTEHELRTGDGRRCVPTGAFPALLRGTAVLFVAWDTAPQDEGGAPDEEDPLDHLPPSVASHAWLARLAPDLALPPPLSFLMLSRDGPICTLHTSRGPGGFLYGAPVLGASPPLPLCAADLAELVWPDYNSPTVAVSLTRGSAASLVLEHDRVGGAVHRGRTVYHTEDAHAGSGDEGGSLMHYDEEEGREEEEGEVDALVGEDSALTPGRAGHTPVLRPDEEEEEEEEEEEVDVEEDAQDWEEDGDEIEVADAESGGAEARRVLALDVEDVEMVEEEEEDDGAEFDGAGSDGVGSDEDEEELAAARAEGEDEGDGDGAGEGLGHDSDAASLEDDVED